MEPGKLKRKQSSVIWIESYGTPPPMSFDMDVNSMQITIIVIEKLDFYFIATKSVARKIETDENTMCDL